jgi:hypothetical protein
MTLSKKKRAMKAARSRLPKYEDRAEFQNRIGPGGYPLDKTEAISWFPKLTLATHPFDGAIDAHCDALVGYGGFQFWLCDVEIGVEPGVYFGTIMDPVPDNDFYLQVEANIGFERRHVFRTRTLIDRSTISIASESAAP